MTKFELIKKLDDEEMAFFLAHLCTRVCANLGMPTVLLDHTFREKLQERIRHTLNEEVEFRGRP